MHNPTQGDASEEIQVTEKTEPKKRGYKDFGHEEEKPTCVYCFFIFPGPALIVFYIFFWLAVALVDMSRVNIKPTRFMCSKIDLFPPQIELKAEDLYNKEKVDLETIVIDDVFKLLECTEEGLSDEEAARRLEIFGPNKLESEEQNAFLQVCRLFTWFSAIRLTPCG